MKKYIFLLLCFYFITGCYSKKTENNINTIVEENKNILIGINYPITGIKKIDYEIQKDIETTYEQFKKQYETISNIEEQSELNIDYTYKTISNRYISITLNVFINSSTLANPNHYMKSYFFDIQKNDFLTIHDVILDVDFSNFLGILKTKIIQKYKDCLLLDEFKSIITEQYNYPLFTIDHKKITVYFNPTTITSSYCGIISVDIPLNQFNHQLSITTEEQMKSVTDYIPISKVIDPNQKVVALTFDDGPSKYTNEILDILAENEAYATFFVIGNKVEIYKNTMIKMIQNGNEIGNHSYNHKWLTKLTDDELKEQIEKTQDVIRSTTGYIPTLIRPTYGSISAKLRRELPLDIVMWTVDTSDWKYKSVDRIVKEATKNIKDLDIILMHDTHERTVLALKKIIPILKEQGFEFVTVSDLKQIKLLRCQK